MEHGKRNDKLSPSREIAYIAVTCALLIGGQYVFSFVAGVEIVTLILVCFSYVFGARRGAVCAAAFSLLRCFIYPFSHTALILYLIYYPLLALVFGSLGHIKECTFKNCPAYFAALVNILLLAIAGACAVCFALDLIKTPRLYKVTLNVLLWVIFALCVAECAAFDVLFVMNRRGKDTAQLLKIITLSSVAAVCTVCFTLLDDIITPLFYGFSRVNALTYFYGSFLAMLPQVVCTIVSVSTMFTPLTAVLKRVLK